MGLVGAVKLGFVGYFDFRTRSSRSEYWWWILFCLLGSIMFSIVDLVAFAPSPDQSFGEIYVAYDSGILSSVFNLVVLIPSISVACRRLHDIGKSGWWQLIGLIPLVGWIILLIWFSRRGDEGWNRFGANPLPSFA